VIPDLENARVVNEKSVSSVELDDFDWTRICGVLDLRMELRVAVQELLSVLPDDAELAQGDFEDFRTKVFAEVARDTALFDPDARDTHDAGARTA